MKKSINIIRLIMYTMLKIIFTPITKVLFLPKVEGRENLPKKKPFIIALNHVSFADVSIIAVTMPFMIRWLARTDVYNKWYMKQIHNIIGTVVANGSVKEALTALEQKDVIGIFPEGTRSSDGIMRKSNIGVAIIALKSGAPVVPIGISGTFKAFPKHAKFPRRYPVLVKIGHPLTFSKTDEEIIEESKLRNVTDNIMAEIKKLLVDI